MIIIETQKDIDIFKLYWDTEPCFVFPVWCDLDKHPMNNTMSFLYIRFRDQETDDGDVVMDFIIPINHNDCLNIELDLSHSSQPKLVYNKKGLLQSDTGIHNIHDIGSYLFFNRYSEYPNGLEIKLIEDLTNFYTRLGFRDNLGKILPIMKWCEVLRDITDPIMDVVVELPLNHLIGKNWIDDTMIPTLSEIERLGIRTDTKKFTDRWPDVSNSKNHSKNLKDDIIYTEYNPYTLTSRPSNRHGGINFGALNKSDGTREVFIPREGNVFIGFDYDAYHIRLIGKLINYELPRTSAHQWLADQYGCTYKESKDRTFTNLYGGISNEDKNIEFFKKTDEVIQYMWERAKNLGYFVTPNNRRIQLDWIESPTPQKIFNYFLQAMETEFNMDVMGKLLERGYGKYLVLYQYDSFTFDIPSDPELKRKLSEIKGILEKNGFPVNGSYGESFDKV